MLNWRYQQQFTQINDGISESILTVSSADNMLLSNGRIITE
jgi:hypothetical protein